MKFKGANKEQIKIILLIPNLGKGGAQRVFHHQFSFLSNSFNVTGCVFNWDGAFEEDRMEKIVSLDVPAGKTMLEKFIFFLLRIKRLRILKKKVGADVTISHLEGADYINVLSKVNDKIICWIHGTKKFDDNIEGILGLIRKNLLIPYLYKRSDKIVTVSKGIENELSRSYAALKPKLLTIYNGFDIESILNKCDESIEDELSLVFQQSKIIITHCRLSRQKNLFALLSIYNSLHKDLDVKLVIIGDGELRNDLLFFCKTIGLEYWAIWDKEVISTNHKVYFFGQQSNPFKFLRHAHIYVMTSGWEGFPLALCEAIVCGVYVLVTDCFTGPREIIAPEIDFPQPIKKPYHTQIGILMPLVRVSENVSKIIWIEEISSALSKVNTNSEQAGIKQIEKFSLSITNHQTAHLIHQIIL